MKLFEMISEDNFPIRKGTSEYTKSKGGFRFSITQALHSKAKEHLMTGMLSTKLMTGAVTIEPQIMMPNNDWKMAALNSFFNGKFEFLKGEVGVSVEGKCDQSE